MGKIALEGLRFHAFHGVYQHEKETGNLFIVDLEVTYDFEEKVVADDLKQTVNYEQLYKIVADVMNEKHNLIEIVALRISDGVKRKFPEIEKINIKVSKANPPIGGECDFASVSLNI